MFGHMGIFCRDLSFGSVSPSRWQVIRWHAPERHLQAAPVSQGTDQLLVSLSGWKV